jgi:K+-transporting ATPase KdpF subunit
MSGPASAFEGPAMSVDFVVGIVLSVLLLAYLGYALLRPERF